MYKSPEDCVVLGNVHVCEPSGHFSCRLFCDNDFLSSDDLPLIILMDVYVNMASFGNDLANGNFEQGLVVEFALNLVEDFSNTR